MSKRTYTILFTSVGRRVALVNAFRRSFDRLGLKGRILGADSSPLAPAQQVCDMPVIVHQCNDPGYIEQLLEICRRESVGLIIPLHDLELVALAGHNEEFQEVGATLCLSSEDVIRKCADKELTYRTLVEAGIDTPQLYPYEQIKDSDLPLFMKPHDGNSAKDIHKLETREQVDFYHRELPQAIIQEFIDGQEYTLDIFADVSGEPLCAVPRKRISVRAGEVVKSMTIKDADLIQVGMDTVRALGGCWGPITLQCFRTSAGRISVIEINPRLGGGVLLSIEAGADIPTWTIQAALGQALEIDPMGFEDRQIMLRYDEAVFVAEDNLPK